MTASTRTTSGNKDKLQNIPSQRVTVTKYYANIYQVRIYKKRYDN